MMRVFGPLHLTVLALLRGRNRDNRASFRVAENSSKAIAGQAIPIVHTGRAFDPTLTSCPIIKTA